MKAAVFTADNGIVLTQRDIREPEPDWVRLAVEAVGICGSDLQIKHGALGSPQGIQPGHELAGVIESVGDNVSLSTGGRVAIEPLHGCGICLYCRTGKPNICTSMQFFGIGQPGGMAEYINIPAKLIYPLPEQISPNIAALSEPMAVCVRGARRADIGLGKRVAIIGAGTIGLLSIVAARAAGATEVFISARHPHQQELAVQLGVTRVYTDTEQLLKELGEHYIDVAIETVGASANTLTEAIQIARSGATVLMLGVFKGEPAIPGLPFFLKELSLVASNCYGHECTDTDFKVATQLVCSYSSLLEPVVTHRYKLDQVDEAFKTAEDKSTRSIKVQISP